MRVGAQFLPAVNSNGALMYNPGLSPCALNCEQIVMQQQSCFSSYLQSVYDPAYGVGTSGAVQLMAGSVAGPLNSALTCLCGNIFAVEMSFKQCLDASQCIDAAPLKQSFAQYYEPMCTSASTGLPPSYDYGTFVQMYLPFAPGNTGITMSAGGIVPNDAAYAGKLGAAGAFTSAATGAASLGLFSATLGLLVFLASSCAV